MSERTPQDVLRELAGLQQEALHFEHPPSDEVIAPYRNVAAMRLMAALTDIDFSALAAALDKAIAEAPDSPPDWGIGYPTRTQTGSAPDTLSEKPGLDAQKMGSLVGRAIQAANQPFITRAATFQELFREAARLGSTDSERR